MSTTHHHGLRAHELAAPPPHYGPGFEAHTIAAHNAGAVLDRANTEWPVDIEVIAHRRVAAQGGRYRTVCWEVRRSTRVLDLDGTLSWWSSEKVACAEAMYRLTGTRALLTVLRDGRPREPTPLPPCFAPLPEPVLLDLEQHDAENAWCARGDE